MQFNTAFLLGFLLGLANQTCANSGHDKQHPEDHCAKHEPGCDGKNVHKMRLQRFEGADCEGSRIGPVAKIEKFKCYTFKKKPTAPLSLNFLLPQSKVLNHCDVTFYDGKECSGEIVQKLYGEDAGTYNAQSHFIRADWVKSVYVGHCI